jgi:hypothetical protein
MVAAGMDCDDGNACTSATKCQSNGSCGGGTTITTCPGADVCHTVGACVPSSGCPAPVLKTGECDDGNLCTTGSTCQSNGTCGGGTVKTCNDNPCKRNSTCQPTNGICSGGQNVDKGTDCAANKVCDGLGNCACRTKSTWNLLTNPTFDGSTSGWTLQGGAAYSTFDVNACSGSGSVAVNAHSDTAGQCLLLSGAQTYSFGYKFTGTGTGNCVLIFYSGTACSGTQLGSAGLEIDAQGTTWVQGVGSGTSPAATTRVFLNCSAAYGAGKYDQLFLSTSPRAAGSF